MIKIASRPRLALAVGLVVIVVAALIIVVTHRGGGGPVQARRAALSGPAPDRITSTGGWVLDSLAVGGTPKVVSGVALVATQSSAQTGVAGHVGSAALDVRTGRVLWRVDDEAIPDELGSTQPLGFATKGGPVAVEAETAGHATDLLVARAARTGAVRWQRKIGRSTADGRSFTPPVTCGASVCIRVDKDGDDPNTSAVEALDPATGDVRWMNDLPDSEDIVYANDTVVVVQTASVLLGLRAGDGHRLWSRSTETDAGLDPEPVDLTSVSWYVLGPTLIASIESDTEGSLTAIDLRTGAVSWRQAGWSFAGQGQPTVADDGITLAGTSVLAVRADGQLAAFAADGHTVWSVAASKYFAAGRTSSQVGWSADRSQVWTSSDQVSWTEGRSTRTGARLAPGSSSIVSIWVPHDPISGLRVVQPYVQLLLNGLPTTAPAPEWAGADTNGRVLQVDGLGTVVSRRPS